MLPLLHRCIRQFLWKYPFWSGGGTLIQLPPLKWLGFPEDPLEVRLLSGYSLKVMPNEFVAKNLFFFGDLDPKVTVVLNALLSKGNTLVDVGANIGTMTFNSLSAIGEEGRVIAIEPQRRCVELLKESISRNKVRNVELWELALSNQDSKTWLSVASEDNLGMSTLEDCRSDMPGELVEVREASSFMRSLDISGEYVVKIDVEGHEAAVLKGLTSYFKDHPAKGVVFETHSHNSSPDCHIHPSVWDALTSRGMVVFQIGKTFCRLEIEKMQSPRASAKTTDFVAVNECSLDAFLRKVSSIPHTRVL